MLMEASKAEVFFMKVSVTKVCSAHITNSVLDINMSHVLQ